MVFPSTDRINNREVLFCPEEADWPLYVKNHDVNYDYKEIKALTKKLGFRPVSDEKSKYSIYVHEYSKSQVHASLFTNNSLNCEPSLITRSPKKMLNKLEETYWSTWKPNKNKEPRRFSRGPYRRKEDQEFTSDADVGQQLVEYFSKSNVPPGRSLDGETNSKIAGKPFSLILEETKSELKHIPEIERNQTTATSDEINSNRVSEVSRPFSAYIENKLLQNVKSSKENKSHHAKKENSSFTTRDQKKLQENKVLQVSQAHKDAKQNKSSKATLKRNDKTFKENKPGIESEENKSKKISTETTQLKSSSDIKEHEEKQLVSTSKISETSNTSNYFGNSQISVETLPLSVQPSHITIPPDSESDTTTHIKTFKHIDSFVINKRRKAEVKPHFQQPKCIKLFKNYSFRGGTYPLASSMSVKKESHTRGNFRLGAPGSPIMVTSNFGSKRGR